MRLQASGLRDRSHLGETKLRGASLVETLIVLALLALGGIAAMRGVGAANVSTAERVATRIRTLDGSGANSPVISDPVSDVSMRWGAREMPFPAPAAEPGDAEPNSSDSPSIFDRAKQLAGGAAARVKQTWDEQLADQREKAKTLVQGSEWIKHRLNDVEDIQTNLDDNIRQRTQDVPGLNAAVDYALNEGEQTVQRGVGSTKSIINLGTGLAVAATDPVDTANGLVNLAAHVPSPLGVSPLKVGLSAYNTATGAEDDQLQRSLNPLTSLQDDKDYLWKTVSAPYKEGWDRGKYTEVGNQAATDVALLFLAPEAAPEAATGEAAVLAGDVVVATGDVATTGGVRVGELAADSTRLGETAGEVSGTTARAGETEAASSAAAPAEPAPASGGGSEPPGSGPGPKSSAGAADEPPPGEGAGQGPAEPGNPAGSAAKIDDVLAETRAGSGNFSSAHELTPNEALEAGERWLGPGYQEMGGNGTGVYRSADGTRQFRIDEGSITGAHPPKGGHVHFEVVDPMRRGRSAVLSNNHVKLR